MEKNYNKREYNGNRQNSARVSYRKNRNTDHKSDDREQSRNFNREDRNSGRGRFYSDKREVNRDSVNRKEDRPVLKRRERNEENRNSGNGYTPRNYYRREDNNNNYGQNSERNAERNTERTDTRRKRIDRSSRENNYSRERRDNRNNSYQRDSRENQDEKRRTYIPRKREYDDRREAVNEEQKEELRKKHYSKKKLLAHRLKTEKEDAELRLNRYISMGGVCSRRDADTLITEGRVKVNGEVVQTVGIKVHKNDRVEVDGAVIIPERKVYLVLNKPKDYVTTVEDPLERKTVMNLIDGACKERIYPIGRLDRQTTGVLLFTNDGDLAKKLTHPKYEHKKIYHVFLDKPLEQKDMDRINAGIELEDGIIKADEINYVSDDQTQVGIEIHSGRNRIVRRIFEHLGYQIVRLDRVYFAGITKKNLPRGRWRFLTPQEVRILKVYNV